MIQSGRLTQTVELQQQSTVENELHEQVNTWAKVKNLRCEKIADTGSERDTSGGQIAADTVRFRCYYDAAITVDRRLIWKGATLDISHVENVGEMDTEMIITATRVSRGGVVAA